MDRGVALVSMAVAIALGATNMTDITLLAHHAPVLGAEPSDTTCGGRWSWPIRPPRTRSPGFGPGPARIWSLIAARPTGFPWLEVAGKLLAGWLVIDWTAR